MITAISTHVLNLSENTQAKKETIQPDLRFETKTTNVKVLKIFPLVPRIRVSSNVSGIVTSNSYLINIRLTLTSCVFVEMNGGTYFIMNRLLKNYDWWLVIMIQAYERKGENSNVLYTLQSDVDTYFYGTSCPTLSVEVS